MKRGTLLVHRMIVVGALFALWIGFGGCHGDSEAMRETGPAAAWPEADRLFRDAALWHGGDAAYSVDLGNDRVLWLFGDSFAGPVIEPGTRAGSLMVRNSVAIQRGYDPTTAAMTFYHGHVDEQPGPFFDTEGARWLWPGDGVRFKSGPLLLTFAVVAASDEGLGFETVGSAAVLIDDPERAPPLWSPRPVDLPSHELGAQLGAGALFAEDGWLYAFAPVEPGSHDVYLARWWLADAERGDLGSPEWWGDDWEPDWSAAQVVARDVQTEFTVHRAPDGLLWLVSVDGFGGANVIVRSARQPEGPWSRPRLLFRPEASDREGILVYSAKAHPELVGGEVVLTYCTNHLDFRTMTEDMELYFPRFARLTPTSRLDGKATRF
jgi:hypothetical protein